MKLTERAPSLYQTVLVYGPPKVGKTQLVGELATHGKKLIWFDLENGVETLLKLPKEAQDRVELISIPDTKDFPVAVETLLKVIKGNEVSICDKHGKVSCPLCIKDSSPVTKVCLSSLDKDTIVVFDSITQLVASAIAHLVKNKPDDYKLNYDDWANLGIIMTRFFDYVQNPKCNIVCISHESEVELEDGKTKLVPVGGTRNFSRNTAKFFGHVVYAQVTMGKHKFISNTVGGTNIVTGSRTDVDLQAQVNTQSLIDVFNKGAHNTHESESKSVSSMLAKLTIVKKD